MVSFLSNSKAGINEAYEGHQGPITAIDTHRVAGQIDFSPYFLTSSFDWTVKLWSIKVWCAGHLVCTVIPVGQDCTLC